MVSVADRHQPGVTDSKSLLRELRRMNDLLERILEQMLELNRKG